MSREPMDRFDDEWKAWTSRPPEISPEEAGRRVLDRLDEPHGWRVLLSRPASRAFPTPAMRWSAAAAAVVLALGVAVLAPPNRPEPPAPATGLDVAPLDEGVVLIWLDSQTPLYMTWDPPHAEKGNPT